jgi:hypothetical protein
MGALKAGNLSHHPKSRVQAVPPRRKEQAKGDGKGDVDLTSTYSALKKLYKENVRPLEVGEAHDPHG